VYYLNSCVPYLLKHHIIFAEIEAAAISLKNYSFTTTRTKLKNRTSYDERLRRRTNEIAQISSLSGSIPFRELIIFMAAKSMLILIDVKGG
jgi:hypothetical protein